MSVPPPVPLREDERTGVVSLDSSGDRIQVPSVLVASAEQMVTDRIIVLLSNRFIVKVVSDSTHLIEQAHSGRWTVILIDIMLPPWHGLEALRHVIAIAPVTPVILLDPAPRPHDMEPYLTGAENVLHREDYAPSALIDTINRSVARSRFRSGINPVIQLSVQQVDMLGRVLIALRAIESELSAFHENQEYRTSRTIIGLFRDLIPTETRKVAATELTKVMTRVMTLLTIILISSMIAGQGISIPQILEWWGPP